MVRPLRFVVCQLIWLLLKSGYAEYYPHPTPPPTLTTPLPPPPPPPRKSELHGVSVTVDEDLIDRAV